MGETEGIINIILKINDIQEAIQEVNVNARSIKTVSFTITKEKVGLYTLDVNGHTGSFTVNALEPVTTVPESTQLPSTSPAPISTETTPAANTTNWLLVCGITVGLIITGLVIIFVARRITRLKRENRA